MPDAHVDLTQDASEAIQEEFRASADILEAIRDKKHPEHRLMKQSVGRKFDPAKFSLVEVNKQLKRAF